ncbi:hypothetical protein ACOME3_000074 [Neoechinorhynchus agilis]
MVNDLLLNNIYEVDLATEIGPPSLSNRFKGLQVEDLSEDNPDENITDDLDDGIKRKSLKNRSSKTTTSEGTMDFPVNLVSPRMIRISEPKTIRVELKYLDPNYNPKLDRLSKSTYTILVNPVRNDYRIALGKLINRIGMERNQDGTFRFIYPSEIIDAEIDVRKHNINAIANLPGQSCRESGSSGYFTNNECPASFIGYIVKSYMTDFEVASTTLEHLFLSCDPISIINLYDNTKHSLAYPNLSYALAIAKHLLNKNDNEADRNLVDSIARYPTVFKLILDRLSINLDDQSQDRLDSLIRTSIPLSDLQEAIALIFVAKTKWSELNVRRLISWFEQMLNMTTKKNLSANYIVDDGSIDRYLVLSTSLVRPGSSTTDFDLVDKAKSILDSRTSQLPMRILSDPCEGSLVPSQGQLVASKDCRSTILSRFGSAVYMFIRAIDPRFIPR